MSKAPYLYDLKFYFIFKCRKLRNRFTGGRHLEILFTDEKLFSVECSSNRDNDRILSSYQKEISLVQRVVKRTQKPAIMVWAGITSTGRTPLYLLIKV